MSRLTSHLRTPLLLLALLAAVPCLPAAEKKATPPPPPPQPVPQKLKVLRGNPVDVTLRIYGRKNQSVTYLIRRAPKAGKLTAPKNTELEVATVQYQPPADSKITSDSFDFAARGSEGVSAPATVEIEIIDIPSELITPAEVAFKPVLTGNTDKQTIEIENRGGRISEGDLFVDPPWKVEVSNHYRIEPGQRRAFVLTFAPDKPGDYTSELRFSSQSDRTTLLKGQAVAALEVKPTAIKLDPVTGALTRAAAIEVTNHTTESQSVRIVTPASLVSDAPIKLAPEQSGTFMIRTKDGEIGPIAGELTAESGVHRTVVPVRADPLPGVVIADPTQLTLKLVPPNPQPMAALVIRNQGGQPARAELTSDVEFQLSATHLDLLVGGESRVEVRLTSGVTPPVDGTIVIKSGGAEQRVAVSAKALPSPGNTTARTATSTASRPSHSTRTTQPAPATTSEANTWSPYEVDITKPIDPAQLVRTVGITPISCTLEWTTDGASAKSFIAEVRELKIQEGRLARLWHPYPNFRTTFSGSKVRGTFDKLQTGRQYTTRVRELTASGEPAAVVFEATFVTQRPGSQSKKTNWTSILGIGGVGAILLVLWRRSRMNAASAVDPKKTQRFS